MVLKVMVIKGYSTFPKTSKLEPHLLVGLVSYPGLSWGWVSAETQSVSSTAATDWTEMQKRKFVFMSMRDDFFGFSHNVLVCS